MAVIEIEVSQTLAFREDDTSSNPQGLWVYDFLTLTDFAQNYSRAYEASNYLNIGQLVNVRKSINHITVGDFLQFFDGGHKSAGLQNIVQWLTIGSLARTVEYEIITHTLNLQQAVTVDFCSPCFHTLTMTQTASARLLRDRSITQTIVISSTGICVIDDDETYSITLPTLTGPNAPECTG